MISDRTPTHPGGALDASAVERGWRLGVADAWRACPDVRIEALGNAGPPDGLAGRAER